MRWRRDDEDDEPEGQVPSEATAPAEEVAADEPAAAATDRPDVPVDLGRIDPTELGRATRRAVARALAEDLGDRGDVTSIAVVPVGARGTAAVVARQDGAVYGLDVLLHVFEQLDTRVDVELHVEDGDAVTAGQQIATLRGPTRSILTGERVALNFLGHLSGICTQTRRYVQAAGSGVALRDTRKTTPGLRLLEKAAVRAGGGRSHRIGLYDAILVKDNHVAAAGGVGPAVRAAQDRGRGRHVQVEVRTVSELDEALEAGVTDVLLDNFDPDETRRAVQRTAGRAALEASGTITLDNLPAYASTGVDRIAIGRLTHSVPWLDVALDVVEVDAGPDVEPEVEPEVGPEGPSPEGSAQGPSVIGELAAQAPVEDGVDRADDAEDAASDEPEPDQTEPDQAERDRTEPDEEDRAPEARGDPGESLFAWRDGPPGPAAGG